MAIVGGKSRKDQSRKVNILIEDICIIVIDFLKIKTLAKCSQVLLRSVYGDSKTFLDHTSKI